MDVLNKRSRTFIADQLQVIIDDGGVNIIFFIYFPVNRSPKVLLAGLCDVTQPLNLHLIIGVLRYFTIVRWASKLLKRLAQLRIRYRLGNCAGRMLTRTVNSKNKIKRGEYLISDIFGVSKLSMAILIDCACMSVRSNHGKSFYRCGIEYGIDRIFIECDLDGF